MHKELKKYSSIGNRNGILLLCKKAFAHEYVSLDSLRISCSFVNGCELNLNCGILAFQALDLIKQTDTHCIVSDPFFLTSDINHATTRLCEKCFSYLIEERLINLDLLKFNEHSELFLIPKRAFSLQSSVFRNLLISLDALIPANEEFRISNAYDYFFVNLVRSFTKKMSLEQLKQKLLDEQDMGEKGELFVLRFEKDRCHFSESQRSRIRQVSHVDVSAGYDIISFHNELDLRRRFIEVKTYKGTPHFYWSENEIESAKIREHDYYLYLVNIDRINDCNYIPEMICNPYQSIIHSDKWRLTPTSFLAEKL